MHETRLAVWGTFLCLIKGTQINNICKQVNEKVIKNKICYSVARLWYIIGNTMIFTAEGPRANFGNSHAEKHNFP